jgi:hypothetical protein
MRIVLSMAIIAALSLNAFAAKQLKQGEYELYNAVLMDLGGNNFAQAGADLDAWRQKFPDSDFKDERSAFYVQTYAGSNQPGRVLDLAGELMVNDLNETFPGADGQPIVLRILYSAVWAITQVRNANEAELATGVRAARLLMAYDHALPGVSPEKWAEARADMQAKAGAALLYVAMLPGVQAMAKQPPDCEVAEAAYRKALTEYPDKTAISYELGRAFACEAKTMPQKQSAAIYEFLRAATVDPTLGDPRNDKKKVQSYADSLYLRMHGSSEGLEQLKEQVKQSPVPPADFKIATADEIAIIKESTWAQDHPQLALWKNIRRELADTEGEKFFGNQLKDTAVPELIGALVEATPACNPRELLIALPLPDGPEKPDAEIKLKLEKPLAGKPDLGTEIRWEGVPSAFTREPFLLTFDIETARIQGLKTTRCVATPARKPASRPSAP